MSERVIINHNYARQELNRWPIEDKNKMPEYTYDFKDSEWDRTAFLYYEQRRKK